MSRIFALVAVALLLTGGAVATGLAQDNSVDTAQANSSAEVLANGYSVMGTIVPLAIVVALVLASLGVFTRI